jgi:hypothetical protein
MTASGGLTEDANNGKSSASNDIPRPPQGQTGSLKIYHKNGAEKIRRAPA